jgi:hypothetical protein
MSAGSTRAANKSHSAAGGPPSRAARLMGTPESAARANSAGEVSGSTYMALCAAPAPCAR